MNREHDSEEPDLLVLGNHLEHVDAGQVLLILGDFGILQHHEENERHEHREHQANVPNHLEAVVLADGGQD